MLGAVRPSGARRSWWLREALAAEPGELTAAAQPLRGSITADVVILGGGYTGLWTAWQLTELAPNARIVVLEADICGGGPSGRNGGFVTGWWDELPTLIERHGRDGALAIARAIDDAIDERPADPLRPRVFRQWCRAGRAWRPDPGGAGVGTSRRPGPPAAARGQASAGVPTGTDALPGGAGRA